MDFNFYSLFIYFFVYSYVFSVTCMPKYTEEEVVSHHVLLRQALVSHPTLYSRLAVVTNVGHHIQVFLWISGIKFGSSWWILPAEPSLSDGIFAFYFEVMSVTAVVLNWDFTHRDICQCMKMSMTVPDGGRVSTQQGPGMWLNILQSTGQPPQEEWASLRYEQSPTYFKFDWKSTLKKLYRGKWPPPKKQNNKQQKKKPKKPNPRS